MISPTYPALDKLRHMPVSDLVALPAEHLAQLQAELRDAVDTAQRMQDCIEAAIALRYEQRAMSARAAAGKHSSPVRLQDGRVEVLVELPRRVEWDQARLATIAEQLRACGENPSHYLEVSLSISETAYIAWPERIRAAVEPARTVRTERATYHLEIASALEGVALQEAAQRRQDAA